MIRAAFFMLLAGLSLLAAPMLSDVVPFAIFVVLALTSLTVATLTVSQPKI